MPAGLIAASTRVCAVFGHPIRHSASPAMHNAAFRVLGLDWCYVACEVRPERLREALLGAQVMGFLGVNLTVPHKLLAVECVDRLDASAAMWGAVNTIRFEGRTGGGAWSPLAEWGERTPEETRSVGFNTDAEAITRSLREDLGVEVSGRRVVLLGAGGAGRAAALKLASEGVGRLFLVNRTVAKARELAEEIRERFGVSVETAYPAEAVDLVLNATSLGLQPGDRSPLDERQMPWKRVGAVYDMIYRPAETRLLKDARSAGCRGCNGLGMLLYQGARALELWCGRPAPVEAMRRALENNLYGTTCT